MSISVEDAVRERALQRPTWQEVVLSFAPPERRTEKAKARLAGLLLPLILVVQAALTWRLSDVTFDDESLYIDAGHDIIRHLLHGATIPNYGSYFSGVPDGYPVIAGALDGLGGLPAVRAYSLACMLLATVALHRSARHLFGERAALWSAAVFAVSGSVLFVGKLATYDATCLLLLSLALLVATTRRGVASGAGVGALLALAAADKYAGAIFVPSVVAVAFLAGLSSRRAEQVRSVLRAVVAGAVAVGLLSAGYHLWGSGIAGGLRFTTTGRHALKYESYPSLVGAFGRDAGLLGILAVIGVAVVFARGSRRGTVIGLVCLAAGLSLPLSQIRIHEFVSLDKHTAFTDLFFALPAGIGIDWAMSQRVRTKLLTLVLVWLLLIDGLWRSDGQYSWPRSILETISVVKADPQPGTYLSLDATTDAYYSKRLPAVRWATPVNLFGLGLPAVRDAVTAGVYEGFIYEDGNESPTELAVQDKMGELLGQDPAYRLAATFRVDRYHSTTWYVWLHVTGPPAGP